MSISRVSSNLEGILFLSQIQFLNMDKLSVREDYGGI